MDVAEIRKFKIPSPTSGEQVFKTATLELQREQTALLAEIRDALEKILERWP